MRWFKHICLSRTDEKVAAYIHKAGMEGYGVYWSILEVIGNLMTKENNWKTEVTYPITRWSTILQLHRTKLIKYFGYPPSDSEVRGGVTSGLGGGLPRGYLEDSGLMVISYSHEGVTVNCPNLLKYKDEYSKKSGVNPDIDRTDSGATPRQDTNTKLNTNTKLKIKNKKINKKEKAIDSPIGDSQSGKPDDASFQKKSELKKQAIEIIDFLNLKTGKKFRKSDITINLISARLKSGATVMDCKDIIIRKTRSWINDAHMCEYIRPSTLFGATNFEQYIGELVVLEEN